MKNYLFILLLGISIPGILKAQAKEKTYNVEVSNTCGVSWGFRSRKELETFNPDYIIDQPEDILKIAQY